MIVSFYVHTYGYMTTSFMKIGGYDSAGFDINYDYFTMETLKSTSWALNLTGMDYQLTSYRDQTNKDTFNLIDTGIER